jgi:hypothetical protein
MSKITQTMEEIRQLEDELFWLDAEDDGQFYEVITRRIDAGKKNVLGSMKWLMNLLSHNEAEKYHLAEHIRKCSKRLNAKQQKSDWIINYLVGLINQLGWDYIETECSILRDNEIVQKSLPSVIFKNPTLESLIQELADNGHKLAVYEDLYEQAKMFRDAHRENEELIRSEILRNMQANGLKKAEHAGMSISYSQGRESVSIVDEKKLQSLPDDYVKVVTTFSAKKKEIKSAFDDGLGSIFSGIAEIVRTPSITVR